LKKVKENEYKFIPNPSLMMVGNVRGIKFIPIMMIDVTKDTKNVRFKCFFFRKIWSKKAKNLIKLKGKFFESQ